MNIELNHRIFFKVSKRVGNAKRLIFTSEYDENKLLFEGKSLSRVVFTLSRLFIGFFLRIF